MQEIHDEASLRLAREYLRDAYHRIQRLPHYDPTIRVVERQVDEICCDLTSDIDAMRPELPLSVRHPVLAEEVPAEPGRVR